MLICRLDLKEKLVGTGKETVYGSKQTKSKGVARGQGVFTNPGHLCYNYYELVFVVITVNTSVMIYMQRFTIVWQCSVV